MSRNGLRNTLGKRAGVKSLVGSYPTTSASMKVKKYHNFDLRIRMEKWSKKYPDNVKVVHCDDSLHMGSRLFLVEHKTKDHYMGTTMIYVPQAGHESVSFLYPSHRDELITALVSIKNVSKIVKKAEKIRVAREARELAKALLPHKLNKNI